MAGRADIGFFDDHPQVVAVGMSYIERVGWRRTAEPTEPHQRPHRPRMPRHGARRGKAAAESQALKGAALVAQGLDRPS